MGLPFAAASAAAALSLLLAFPALAGDGMEEPGTGISRPTERPGAPPSAIRFQVDGGLSTQGREGLDGGGSVSIDRFRIGLRMTGPVDAATGYDLRFRAQDARYDFGSGPDPWGAIHTTNFAAILQKKLDDRWTIYGGPNVTTAGEAGAAVGESTSVGGLVAFQYKWSDTFDLGAGLGAVTRLEDSVQPLPVLTLNWRPVGNWKFAAGLIDFAPSGFGLAYGAEATWTPSPRWTFSALAHFHLSRFRLDDHGANPDGIGQERATALVAQARWAVTPTITLQAYAGLALGGNLSVEDSHGNRFYGSDYDPAPVAGLMVSLNF